ncbi:MAG: ribose 5-phosphate isomerase B [Limnochordia bacterium]
MGKSILFICSGNTCRSVMAEYLLRHRAKEAGLNLEATSAGLFAFTGDAATEEALQALSELGIDAREHRSRKLHPRLLDEADLVLAMTERHKEELLRLAPEQAGKIFLLKEYADILTSGQEAQQSAEKEYEIPDPFGQSLEAYRRARQEIDRAVQAIIAQSMGKGGKNMRIAVGSDHGGFQAKQVIIEHLRSRGLEAVDFGTDSEESCDYPDIAQPVAEAVRSGECTFGILICGTGIGMSIAANKIKGIRAALCNDTFSARMAREHNDANILCLGARVLGLGLMLDIVDVYLNGSFVGGRHKTRVEKIDALD